MAVPLTPVIVDVVLAVSKRSHRRLPSSTLVAAVMHPANSRTSAEISVLFIVIILVILQFNDKDTEKKALLLTLPTILTNIESISK
jgi:hypothetical protein